MQEKFSSTLFLFNAHSSALLKIPLYFLKINKQVDNLTHLENLNMLLYLDLKITDADPLGKSVYWINSGCSNYWQWGVFLTGYIVVTDFRLFFEQNLFPRSHFSMYFLPKQFAQNHRWCASLSVFTVDKPNPIVFKITIFEKFKYKFQRYFN